MLNNFQQLIGDAYINNANIALKQENLDHIIKNETFWHTMKYNSEQAQQFARSQ